MLYKSLDKYSLREEFKSYDRDYYSYEGYEAILEYFEDCDSNAELDVIGICCDFNEYSEEEIRSDYSLDEDDNLERYLSDNTWYQKLDNGNYLYLAF